MKIRLRRHVLALAALWTLVIGILFCMDRHRTNEEMVNLARLGARGLFRDYEVFLNREFMTQEFHESVAKESGGIGHITSLTASNPDTVPDAWETAALRRFESGERETSSLETNAGEPRLRYMAPLTMKEQCLACHMDQDRRPGQTYGGVSVSIPMASHYAAARAHVRYTAVEYAALWVLGLLGLGMGGRSLGRRIAQGKQAEESLRASESRLSAITDSAQDAILMMDPQGRISYWNPGAERIFGYTRSEASGQNLHRLIAPPRYHEAHDAAFPEFQRTGEGAAVGKTLELHALCKDGREIAVSLSLSAVRIKEDWHAVGILRDITEQEHAKEALRRSEEEKRLLFERAISAIAVHEIVLDAAGQPVDFIFLDANPAFETHTGLHVADILGRRVTEILPGIEKSHFIDIYGEVVQTGEPVSFEQYAEQLGRHFFINAYRLSEKRFAAVFIDITGRKQTEEAIRASEERFRVLFESSRDAIMTLEPPTWQFTSGNPATVAMFKAKDTQDFLTHGPGDVSPEWQPDGRPSGEKAKEMIGTAMREGSNFFEWTHARLNGEIFPATVLLTRMEYGGKTILQATIRDITAQKRAEEERGKTLHQQQGISLLEQSLLAPAPLDTKLKTITDGIVRLFDADFCRIWLIRPGDLCERDCMHALVQEGPHVCRFRDRCLHLLASSGRYTHTDGKGHRRVPFGCYKIGRVASAEERGFITNDAANDPRVHNHEWVRELGLVSFAGYQIRIPGAETLGVLALFAKHPISEEEDALLDGLSSAIAFVVHQAAAEDALRETMEQLQTANSGLEAAVERANQMALEAQAANIAKSQFLANMSHEIRTPMNGVIGMTGLLLDTTLSDEQRRYAEVVRTSGESLLSILNDILDFSKIEADKMDLENLDFDLRAMIEDVAELLAVRANEKSLDFVCHIAPEVHTFLRGDPGRLRQILLNLGGNAVKFTARGEVIIEARLESETADQARVRFEVRDTGIGIPPDKIDILFSAFQQVDASTTRRFGGTGLGLAVSKRLAELMGGQVGIESVEGKGSTFWFTVPLAKQPPRDRHEGLPHAEIRGVHALAVDDNATNRLVVTEQLASWGMRHAQAESAAQALRMLHEARAAGDPFRIVLTDMQMPSMDGEALGVAIKADPALRDTLLVMMTSLGKRGDAKRIEAIGFAAYLTKPVKQSQLFDCLVTVLGTAHAASPLPEKVLVTRHVLNEARRKKIRILLAEDNITNQQVALRVLEKMGFRADVAADGQEAIRALEAIPYDLVFMDVQMPIMDGFTATQAIRSGKTRAPNPAVPIVAMTAHAMKGDRERCIEAGMDDYIPKPISPNDLAAAIEKWVGRAKEPPPATPTPAETAPSEVRQRAPASVPAETPPIPGTPASLPAETPPIPRAPIFDRQAFLSRLMNDEDLAKQITAAFLDDIPKQMEDLKKHLAEGDSVQAGKRAHAIKGASANVGGMALSAIAATMEKDGKDGRLRDVAAGMPELERQFDTLKTQMLESAS